MFFPLVLGSALSVIRYLALALCCPYRVDCVIKIQKPGRMAAYCCYPLSGLLTIAYVLAGYRCPAKLLLTLYLFLPKYKQKVI